MKLGPASVREQQRVHIILRLSVYLSGASFLIFFQLVWQLAVTSCLAPGISASTILHLIGITAGNSIIRDSIELQGVEWLPL